MKPVRWLGAILAPLLAYALGVPAAGARLQSARRLRLGRPFTIGRNTRYLNRGRTVSGVLKVRHDVIEEVGIADGRLLTSRRDARRFLKSFR